MAIVRMKQRMVCDVCRERGALGDGLSVGLCGEDKAVGGMGACARMGFALGGLGLCGVWVHVEMERVGAVRGQDECRVIPLRGQGQRGDGAHWGMECGIREHWGDKESVLLWCMRAQVHLGGQGKGQGAL